MAANETPPPSPDGVPTSGGGKYILLALALLGSIAATVAWKLSRPAPTPQIVYVDAAAPSSSQSPAPKAANTGRNLDDEVPLPPPVGDAGPSDTTAKKPASSGDSWTALQCEVKKCGGSTSPELERALQIRANQSHRCYDNALAQDPTLRGKLSVALRVATNGSVCSASIASNEIGSEQVAQCVANQFRSAKFPAPRYGCVDVVVPMNMVPRQ
jgi:hypothetical protein